MNALKYCIFVLLCTQALPGQTRPLSQLLSKADVVVSADIQSGQQVDKSVVWQAVVAEVYNGDVSSGSSIRITWVATRDPRFPHNLPCNRGLFFLRRLASSAYDLIPVEAGSILTWHSYYRLSSPPPGGPN